MALAAVDAGEPEAALDAIDRARRVLDVELHDVTLPPLTPRERSLLALLSEGCTNRQIADRLHLSEKTVRNQLSSLFAKLGIDRRTKAAVLAVQLGLGDATAGDAPPAGT